MSDPGAASPATDEEQWEARARARAFGMNGRQIESPVAAGLSLAQGPSRSAMPTECGAVSAKPCRA